MPYLTSNIHNTFHSFNQAQSIADRYAREHNQTVYVVYEGGDFFIATDEDLETFFMGLSDNQIRYCTGDSQ